MIPYHVSQSQSLSISLSLRQTTSRVPPSLVVAHSPLACPCIHTILTECTPWRRNTGELIRLIYWALLAVVGPVSLFTRLIYRADLAVNRALLAVSGYV